MEGPIAPSREINAMITQKVKDFCREMTPYVDSIQVFATKHEGDNTGTTEFSWGAGNYWARMGQIANWVSIEKAMNIEDEKQLREDNDASS